MIKLATPISRLFLKQHSAQNIMMISDSLECREWCIDAQYPKQELIHFDINIIHYWDKELRRYIYSSILSKLMVELVTFHVSASCDAPVLLKGMYQPGGKQYSREELLDNAKTNILWLRTFLNEKTLIGVENNNYYPTQAYRYITDCDFLTQIVEENNIKFLLDIAHAKITAYNRKMDYERYRAALPLKDTIQIHISKHKINSENIAYDAHELPDESIYREVCGLVEAFPVKYLTLEYYNDIEKVLQELGRYKKLKEELSR
jgi:uncharacterized protein (UPF0276 family)